MDKSEVTGGAEMEKRKKFNNLGYLYPGKTALLTNSKGWDAF